MIYQIKDNQKIPLGTQFDNSWVIEYDRDFSSQLAGQHDWTAPEDCWFQYHSIFYSKPTDTNPSNNVTLTIQLNGIVVANTDNILDSDGGTLYEITASVLMKKGDVISYKNTADGLQAPPFTAKCGKIFPVHRILSNREGERDRSYAIWNTERNADYWLIADKPQGIVHVSFLANNQWMDIIWNVATEETRQMGPTGGDAILKGMEDPVYGRPYLMVRTTENIGSYFIDTVDCVLTVERRPH